MHIKSSSKMAEIMQVMIKRVLIFLDGIVCKHLLVWAFFRQSAFTLALGNIYQKSSRA
jgi:hypothetical protein